MKRQLRDRWVEALRSGKYTQGQGYLKKGLDHPAYCCLGVLCELLDIPSRPQNTDSDIFSYPAGGGTEVDGSFMNVMYELSGLDYEDEHTLIFMNDDGVPFTEIANWVEENVAVED